MAGWHACVALSLSPAPLHPFLWEEGLRKHLHVFSCLLLQKAREQGHLLGPFPSRSGLGSFLLSSWQTILTEVLPHEDHQPFISMISIQRDHTCPPPVELVWDFCNPPPHYDKEFTVMRTLDLYLGYKGRFQGKYKLAKRVTGFLCKLMVAQCNFFFFPDGFAIGQEK